MAKIKMKKGFTLIEILVVSGVMVMFSLTIVGLFLSTIRGSAKTEVVQKVRQDGDFALKTITRLIKEADSVEVVGFGCTEAGTLPGSSIIVNDIYGGVATFSIKEDVGAEISRIASTSGSTDFFLTGVTSEVSDMSFICYQRSSGNQIVTISFTLTIGAEEGAQVQEKEGQDFKTSVSLRKY